MWRGYGSKWFWQSPLTIPENLAIVKCQFSLDEYPCQPCRNFTQMKMWIGRPITVPIGVLSPIEIKKAASLGKGAIKNFNVQFKASVYIIIGRCFSKRYFRHFNDIYSIEILIKLYIFEKIDNRVDFLRLLDIL